MYKKAKLVMLPTDEKANLKSDLAINENNLLFQPSKLEGTWFFLNKFQHLYILSDEEIKVGDWVIKNGHTTVFQVEIGSRVDNCKKIIATTDKSLKIKNPPFQGYNLPDSILPQPLQSFIQKYVEEYNKGNVITEVMVEYETDYLTPLTKMELGFIENGMYSESKIRDSWYTKLKINQDNTINIKPIKDSWSREELYSIMQQYHEYCVWTKTYITPMQWIEENL